MNNVEQIVQRILTEQKDFQIDGGSASLARSIIERLKELKFKSSRTYDYCKVASYESVVDNGTLKVKVLSSNFLGPFVEIEVRKGVY